MWWLCQGIGAWLGLKLERTRCQLLVAVKARYACASTTCSLLPCPGGLSADDEKKHGRSSTCLRHVALFFVQGCYVNRNRNGRGSCERETCGLGWKTGKDQGGVDASGPDGEQVWQDRLKKTERRGQTTARQGTAGGVVAPADSGGRSSEEEGGRPQGCVRQPSFY